MSETKPPELVTVYYIAEERAMAPGIAGGYDAWPQTIPAPHTKNGRLSKLPKEFGDDIAKAAAYDEAMSALRLLRPECFCAIECRVGCDLCAFVGRELAANRFTP